MNFSSAIFANGVPLNLILFEEDISIFLDIKAHMMMEPLYLALLCFWPFFHLQNGKNIKVLK